MYVHCHIESLMKNSSLAHMFEPFFQHKAMVGSKSKLVFLSLVFRGKKMKCYPGMHYVTVQYLITLKFLGERSKIFPAGPWKISIFFWNRDSHVREQNSNYVWKFSTNYQKFLAICQGNESIFYHSFMITVLLVRNFWQISEIEAVGKIKFE